MVEHFVDNENVGGSSPSSPIIGTVAQLDRASRYGREGLGFESLQFHHFINMETKIFIALIITWLSLFYLAVKYDYRSWPDIPGVNCVALPE